MQNYTFVSREMVCLTGWQSCLPIWLLHFGCVVQEKNSTVTGYFNALFELNQRCRPTLLITSLFDFFLKWVFLMLGQQILQGGWLGQHVSIKLQYSSTLVNKKLHPIVRAHYACKIKCLVHGKMWSLHGLILCWFFFRGFVGAGETEIKSFLNALFK